MELDTLEHAKWCRQRGLLNPQDLDRMRRIAPHIQVRARTLEEAADMFRPFVGFWDPNYNWRS